MIRAIHPARRLTRAEAAEGFAELKRFIASLDFATDTTKTAKTNMKITIPTEVEFEPVRLIVSAKPRYWEDAIVNGQEDTDGTLMPLCSKSGEWSPVIDLSSGRVMDWPQGTTASIHYKVCDEGEYWLEDKAGRRAKYRSEYVPALLAVGEHGYGDYIIMNIRPDGLIENWLTPFIDGDLWKL